MNKEIKITRDENTNGYLFLKVEYTNSNGNDCKLVRTRSNYGRGACGLTGCNTNQNVALYIDDKLINSGWFSSSITDNDNRINIHNQLLNK
tara:strand:- start:143 stop:415 length:273 start_codon:yes stop_codon:yes gene_type:complete